MLEVKQLKKQLQRQVVLQDLDMKVPDGCIYGLIGPNGAGKSTLLRVISGVYPCDQGVVLLDGYDMAQDPARRCEILLIGDDPFYFHNATLRDMKRFYQITYPDLDEAYYHDLIKQFDLNDKELLQRYSKGMKRQAFLILGLCCAPRYLLLDEAFDGLDPHMRLLFKQAIVQRLEDQQMSVIISSHDLKEMEEICDRFAILEGGKLITSGGMQEQLNQIHRFQLAFDKPVKETLFDSLPLLSLSMDSRIANLVVQGDREVLERKLRAFDPLMLEALPISLEEMFVYVMRQREERTS